MQFDRETHPIDYAPQYDTLFNRWKDLDPQFSESKIFCNGISIDVGQDSHLALIQIALLGNRLEYIWVVCICIHQFDIAKKQVKILTMFQIFSQAPKVIMCIGFALEADHTDLISQFFPSLAESSDFVNGLESEKLVSLMSRENLDHRLAMV